MEVIFIETQILTAENDWFFIRLFQISDYLRNIKTSILRKYSMKLFDLSPEDFNQFLLLFDLDRDKAGEKYERLRRKLRMMFSKRGCHNINELVDKVFDQIFTMLIKGKTIEKIDNLSVYIARRHTLQRYWDEVSNNQQNFVSINDDFILDIDNFINQNNQEERLKKDEELILKGIFSDLYDEKDKRLIHLRFCMDKHTKTTDEKIMMLTYYHDEGQKLHQVRKNLADYLGIKQGNLRQKVNRLGEKLFECIDNCINKEVC